MCPGPEVFVALAAERGSKDPGRFTYGKADLLSLIHYAYNVNTFEVQSRIPLDRDAFDSVAEVPEEATKEDLRARLRNLPADRFNLKVHVKKKDFDSAVLVVAPGGLKMPPSGTKSTAAPRRRTSACEFPVLPMGKPGFVSQLGRACLVLAGAFCSTTQRLNATTL
jgi:uncharacterized protein (TIGR03435 family)